eukprot:1159555-Pelagomonas_calceolata.AAC.13
MASGLLFPRPARVHDLIHPFRSTSDFCLQAWQSELSNTALPKPCSTKVNEKAHSSRLLCRADKGARPCMHNHPQNPALAG